MKKSIKYYILALIGSSFLGYTILNSQAVGVTSGKSFFRTVEELIILETANNRRPTISQGPVAFIADTIIYDEGEKIGYAYGDLRFADLGNRTFFSAQEGTYFTKENKIVLRKTPEILLEQDDDISTKITGRVITIYPDDSYIHVQGNIQIDDGSTFVTGEEVRIWNKQNRMVVTGNVQSLSGQQKLASDRLSVQFTNGGLSYYVARGNVKAVNPEDKFTIMSGLLSYDNKTEFFRATMDPLLFFQEQNSVSYANIIEYTRPTKIGYLVGDVITVQDSGAQKAFSRWARYNGSNDIINMYGSPRLQKDGSEVFGTEIVVNVESNNMQILGGGQGFFNRNQ